MVMPPYELGRTDSPRAVNRANVVIVIPAADDPGGADPYEQAIADILGAIQAGDILASAPTARDGDKVMAWNGNSFELIEVGEDNLADNVIERFLPHIPPGSPNLFIRTDANGVEYQLAAIRAADIPTLDASKIRLSTTGDIALSSVGGVLVGTIKSGVVSPGDLRFDANTLVANRQVAINADSSGFVTTEPAAAELPSGGMANEVLLRDGANAAAWGKVDTENIAEEAVGANELYTVNEGVDGDTLIRRPALGSGGMQWEAPTGGGGGNGGGLTAVASDDTLTGTGAVGSPLAVANPFPADAADDQRWYRKTESRDQVFDAFDGGEWLDSEGDVANYFSAQRPTLTNAQAGSRVWASSFQVSFHRTNYYALVRLPLSVGAEDYDHRRVRIGDPTGLQEGDPPTIVLTAAMRIGADASWQYFAPQVPDHPAADSIILQSREDYTLDREIVSMDIAPSDLVGGGLRPGQVPRVTDDGRAFEGLVAAVPREIFSGTLTGVAVQAGATSSVQRTNLTDAVDLDVENHGLVNGIATLNIEGSSSGAILFDNGATAKDVDLRTSLARILAAPAYLATSSDLGVAILQEDVYDGSDVAGVFVIRAARDSQNRVDLNDQYIREQADDSTANYSIVPRNVELYLEDAGIPHGGGTGSAGPLYEYEDALPDPAPFADGTLALLYGATKSLSRKKTDTVHVKADTGLAGLDLNPTGSGANLSAPTTGERYAHMYVARTSFSNRDGTTRAANNSIWADMPAALDWLDFNYRASTRGDGELRFHFNAARTYTGELVITPGSDNAIHVPRISSTVWGITGLSAAQVGSLRENMWRFSEPGVSGTTNTPSWETILSAGGGAGGEEMLMDFTRQVTSEFANPSNVRIRQRL